MTKTLLAGLLMCVTALPALADEPVTIADIRFGPDLLDKAAEYGPEELDVLAEYLHEDLSEALAGIMMDDGTVLQARIMDATPNRPTREQIRDTPGLSYQHSFSMGGAEVEADLVSANGEIIDQFEYSWRTRQLRDAQYRRTWSDARRTFSRFATQVREEVQEHARTGS